MASKSSAGIISFSPIVYGYSNARVRAMRTNLLTRKQAEEILKVQTNAGVAEYLSKTHVYRDDFANLPPRITDEERVEIAVSRNFARTAQKLYGFTPGQNKDAIRAFLGRYDVHNVKSVLLARKFGKTKEEFRHLLIPAGTFTTEKLEQMFTAKSVDELYNLLKANSFGAGFFNSRSMKEISQAQVRSALAQSSESEAVLEILLAALDTYNYEVASRAIPPHERDSEFIRTLLRSQIDAKNAMIVLRLKRDGATRQQITKCLLRGGKFSGTQLEKMADAKSLPDAVKLASDFFISKTGRNEFTAAEQKFLADGQLSHFEVVFENSLARRSLRTLRLSMMSIGTIVGFLFLKEEEMNNMRKIVRGKSFKLPPEKIAEMLVFVG